VGTFVAQVGLFFTQVSVGPQHMHTSIKKLLIWDVIVSSCISKQESVLGTQTYDSVANLLPVMILL